MFSVALLVGHSPVVSSQEKCAGHMDIPPVTVIRHSRSHLYQPFYQPVHRPVDLFANEVELSKKLDKIVRQNSNEQPGVVCGESMATRLVRIQSSIRHH
jgi:hypothetical protein